MEKGVGFMLQDLAALAPPVIVCAAFVAGAWVIVRKELAPKRRRQAEQAQSAPPSGEPGTGQADGGQAAN
jgi:hypothetical protein